MRQRFLSFIGNAICFYLAFVTSPFGWMPHFTGMPLSAFHAIASCLALIFAADMILDEIRDSRTGSGKPAARSVTCEDIYPAGGKGYVANGNDSGRWVPHRFRFFGGASSVGATEGELDGNSKTPFFRQTGRPQRDLNNMNTNWHAFRQAMRNPIEPLR